MTSSSPESSKNTHYLLRKIGEKFEKTFHLSNSKLFHTSLPSLNDVSNSSYHSKTGDDEVSLQNLPVYNSPKLKLHNQCGKIQ